MNVDLEKTFSFSCLLLNSDEKPWINSYDVRIQMNPNTTDRSEYNVAYSRLKYWIDQIMQDSVLCELHDPRMPALTSAGLRCLDFPVDPVDQVVGMMLMSKLTAICENKFHIQQLAINSLADDFVWYMCDKQDDLHWFESPGWWNDTRPVYNTARKNPKNSGKVIAMSRTSDWKDHDLDWITTVMTTGNVSVLPGPDIHE